MHWNNLHDFLAMGGYAGYVWPSFGLAALLMVAEPYLLARRRKQLVTQLRRRQALENITESPCP